MSAKSAEFSGRLTGGFGPAPISGPDVAGPRDAPAGDGRQGLFSVHGKLPILAGEESRSGRGLADLDIVERLGAAAGRQQQREGQGNRDQAEMAFHEPGGFHTIGPPLKLHARTDKNSLYIVKIHPGTVKLVVADTAV